jgi:septum site-determining protein MinD
MAIKIFMTSKKGGTGVSSLCLGIGSALAHKGMKTLIVDGDISGNSILLMSGCSGKTLYTLSDYKQGACRAKQMLVEVSSAKNLYVLPMFACDDSQLLKRAIAEIEGLFDYILCDNCVGVVCDKAITITEPYVPAIKCADVSVAELHDSGMKDVLVIVNKVNGGFIYEGDILPPSEIAYLLHCELLAVIPEDLTMPLGKWKKDTQKAFKLAAENLTGSKKRIYSPTAGFVGLTGYFKRKLRYWI